MTSQFDFPIYLTILILSLFFILLTGYDRLFGIVGIFVTFIGGLFLANNNVLTLNTVYTTGCSCWISYFASAQEVQLMALILGLTAVIGTVRLIIGR